MGFPSPSDLRLEIFAKPRLPQSRRDREDLKIPRAELFPILCSPLGVGVLSGNGRSCLQCNRELFAAGRNTFTLLKHANINLHTSHLQTVAERRIVLSGKLSRVYEAMRIAFNIFCTSLETFDLCFSLSAGFFFTTFRNLWPPLLFHPFRAAIMQM